MVGGGYKGEGSGSDDFCVRDSPTWCEEKQRWFKQEFIETALGLNKNLLKQRWFKQE